jgi:hypothetical protein
MGKFLTKMTGLYICFSSSPLLLDIPSFLSAELMVYRHVQDGSVLEYPECWWREGTKSRASLPVFTVHRDTPVLHCVKEAFKASGAVDDGAGDLVDNSSAHKDSVTAVAQGVAPRCHGSDFALTPPPVNSGHVQTWRLSAGQVRSSSITLIQSRQLRSPRSPHHHRRASGYYSSHHIHLYRSLCRCPVPSPSNTPTFIPLSSFILPYV